MSEKVPASTGSYFITPKEPVTSLSEVKQPSEYDLPERCCGRCKHWSAYSIWSNRLKLPPDTKFKGSCVAGPPCAEPATKKALFPVTEHLIFCGKFTPTTPLVCSFCGLSETDSKLYINEKVAICVECAKSALLVLQ